MTIPQILQKTRTEKLGKTLMRAQYNTFLFLERARTRAQYKTEDCKMRSKHVTKKTQGLPLEAPLLIPNKAQTNEARHRKLPADPQSERGHLNNQYTHKRPFSVAKTIHLNVKPRVVIFPQYKNNDTYTRQKLIIRTHKNCWLSVLSRNIDDFLWNWPSGCADFMMIVNDSRMKMSIHFEQQEPFQKPVFKMSKSTLITTLVREIILTKETVTRFLQLLV